MMDGLCPNLYFSASRKYVTTHSCEFTKKYPYSPNNLIMNLSNQMFLFKTVVSWSD